MHGTRNPSTQNKSRQTTGKDFRTYLQISLYNSQRIPGLPQTNNMHQTHFEIIHLSWNMIPGIRPKSYPYIRAQQHMEKAQPTQSQELQCFTPTLTPSSGPQTRIRKANPKRGWHNVTKRSTEDGNRHEPEITTFTPILTPPSGPQTRICKANPKRGWHNVTKRSTVDGNRHIYQLLPGSTYSTKTTTWLAQ